VLTVLMQQNFIYKDKFLKKFDELLVQDSEQPGKLAFLIVKLKRFKDINTAYGFKVGDMFIQQSGECLSAVLRPVDVISRFSDNEFALLLPGLHNPSHAILAANKIITECTKQIVCNGIEIEPRLAVGIVIAQEHGNNHDDLIHHAAMALSKAEIVNEHYYIYDPDFMGSKDSYSNTQLPPRLILEQELHHAFDHDEFCLNFQPKVDLMKKCASGSEVLIRWHSSKYGLVDTESFINVLERSDLLLPVTKWILNSALRQCAQCSSLTDGFSVSVNLSPALLNDRSIIDIIAGALKIWGTSPESLVMEVTENAIMADPEQSLEILREMKALGVGISIDDFGTGFSSLAYLKNMPACELKIDKSFVLNMLDHEKNTSIVQSTIDLAHSLGMHVVAEGIENRKVLEKLTEMGCDYGQGYLMGRPMSYDEMRQWLAESYWAGN